MHAHEKVEAQAKDRKARRSLMDRESYRLKMDLNAAAAGIGIGLALIAGAIVNCGTESEQTRKRKVLPPSDVAGDTATKGDVPDSAANSDSDDDDDGAMVGERHSNTRGLQAEAGLQHIAHVFVPVRAVSSERDHAMSNPPSSFNRCATCHRKSTCDPVNCELHEHVRKRNEDGELCSSPDPSRCSA